MAMNESMRKTLKDLAVWVVTIPIAAWIFTAVINLIIKPATVGIKFTPSHFGSPSLPLSPLKLLGGVSEGFGIFSAILLLPLLFLFFYFLIVTLREFREWTGVEEADTSIDTTEYPKLALTPETRSIVLKWGSAFIVIAIIVRVLLTQPLVRDVSIPGKFLLAGKFLASFNAGLVKKSSFKEVEYTYLMLDGLKFDRNEYFRFAESEYWAFFASRGVTKSTEREKIAAKELVDLFNGGHLKEDSLERAAALMKKGGEGDTAEEAVEELRNSK